MRKSWLVCLVAVSMFTAVSLRANAQAEKKDDVFMDEGDGDFDSMPAVPQVLPKGKATKTNAPVAAEPVAPAPEAPPAEQASAPAPVDVPEAAPVKEAPSEEAQNAEPKVPAKAAGVIEVEHQHASKNAPPKIDSPAAEPPADQAAPTEEAAAPAPAPAKQAKHKSAVAGVAPHGTFAVTNGPCPMTREPASESEKMITVKASRKIWVEKVDGDWVRAFNKAGEPGYIQTSCVQLAN